LTLEKSARVFKTTTTTATATTSKSFSVELEKKLSIKQELKAFFSTR
jgi:hypothetical protein